MKLPSNQSRKNWVYRRPGNLKTEAKTDTEMSVHVSEEIWATSWENLIMAYANIKGPNQWTTKAQTSLRIRAVWTAPLLFASKIYLLYPKFQASS